MRYWLVLTVCSLVYSCGLISTSDPVVVTSIDEELRLDLWNPLGAEHSLQLNLSTLDPKCATSEIVTSYSQQGLNLQISIQGLPQSGSCQGTQEILQSSIPAFISPGVFNVTIDLSKSFTNSGKLTFDGQVYVLTMESSDGLEIGHDRLYKIPPGTIWGNISSDQDASAINAEFLADFDGVGMVADLPSGYYGHFTVTDADVQLVPTEQRIFNYPFIYALTGQLSELQAMIDDLRASYGNQVSIECTTWSGKSL